MSTAFSSSNFDSEEYFAFRPHYPQKLFDFIYAYHSNSSNATFSKAIDLASGCGQATFPLSLKLESVIGVEPSDEMLKISNSLKEQDYRKIFDLPPVTSDSEKKNIEFVKGTAEKLDFLNDGSVDLILTTVGCNWFDWFSDAPSDENRIWKEFDRVLKPSGSVALVGYWNWITKEYSLLNSMLHALGNSFEEASQNEQGPLSSIAKNSKRIVHSFYDAIPDPPSSKFVENQTLRWKSDLGKAKECDEATGILQTKEESNELPEYLAKILSKDETSNFSISAQDDGDMDPTSGDSISTPLRKIMKLSDYVASMRTQSRFVSYYASHQEEKEKIKDRKDLIWRVAEESRVKQAIIDSAKELGERLSENDERLRKYLWDWEKECEIIYPMMILFAKKKEA